MRDIDEIVIDKEKDFFNVDEYYGPWYICPNCENNCINTGFNYCPECGVKLIWNE